MLTYENTMVMEAGRFTLVGKQDLKQMALRWSLLSSVSPDHLPVSFPFIILLEFLR